MDPPSSDVIVVGGGPCGSFTALNLAKQGCDVQVFEEHDTIGLPCHCAGHLTLKGLKLLGLHPLPSRIIENIFYGAIFHSPKGRKIRVNFSSPVTCAVNRTAFDKYIARMAQESGAHFNLNSRVQSLITKKGRVKGVIYKIGETKERTFANVIVDAEGISSRILKQAGLTSSTHLVKAVEAEAENVKNLEKDKVEIFLDKDYAPGFYAWLMPKGDDAAKVGLASKSGNPRELLKKLMSQHPTASEKLRTANITSTTFHSIPLGGPIPQSFSEGFIAVGDAASQVKPTTGGGVIFGMTCAKIAAKVVYKSVQRSDFSSEFLSKYQKRCNHILASEIKIMLLIRKMLDSLSDDKLDDIFSFCQKIGLNKAVQNFEDIDFQARSLLQGLRNPRVPVTLLYFFLSYLLANRRPPFGEGRTQK